MSDYSYKSEVNDINPIAHEYNRLVRKNNLTLIKYGELQSKPITQKRKDKETKLIIKLSKLQQKIDDLGHLLESEYE